MFDMFDLKHDGVIDFGEFIRSLSIFHPDTPQEEKAVCMDTISLYVFSFYTNIIQELI